MAAPALASVRAFAGLEDLDAAMETRDVYRRYGNSTVRLLEEAMAALEAPPGGDPPLARVTASGQAALALAVAAVATPRRRCVVVVRPCYGGSDALVAGPLGNLGVSLRTVDLPPGGGADHRALVAAALDETVAVVVAEVITNPLMQVVDVPAVAGAARDAGAALLVDATFATPFLFQPFAHGADLVMHSLTKHLSGHSDVVGGVLLARADHPAVDWLDGFCRLLGVGLAPFDAWLALRGLRTAALRVERGSANAASLVAWLREQEGVAAVHYPGNGGSCDAERAARLLPHGRGPLFSIDVAGGQEAAAAVVRRFSGVRLAPSLGDVATTVTHPGLSSHRTQSREQRAALGIGDGLLRVSTGIEALADLQREFAAALGGTM